MFPLCAWDLIEHAEADQALTAWGHFLGPCNRPFGRQSFGLWLDGRLVAVAVSASTVNEHCAGYSRREVVELARLCAHPEHHDLTRVALRLWRVTAPRLWSARYWRVRALVSYANTARRHTGDVYRLDGWKKFADVPGGVAGGNWTRNKRYDPKSVWVYELPAPPGPSGPAIPPHQSQPDSGAQANLFESKFQSMIPPRSTEP